MLFHSLNFILFFVLIFFLNLLFVNILHKQNSRKWLLLISSIAFYVSWSFPLFFLMLFCIVINFFSGLQVEKKVKQRKMWISLSVFVNLSILAIFKYLNFCIESMTELMQSFGFQVNIGTFEIILPLGISFYTFQSMGYVIDVYREKYPPYKSFVDFCLFVSFFPQLIAGPIVRADFFLRSLEVAKNRITLANFNNGLFLFVLGIFKKVALADNAAHIANMAFSNYSDLSGCFIILGVYAFAAQIYFDFSGYTDMAKGLAAMLGIHLPQNFNRPYIALGIRDFWQRWHISLSTWLRDYLYISLGGSRVKNWKIYRNLFLTMLLGGLWHGASMNFVIWGAIHGFLLIAEHYLNSLGWQTKKVSKFWLRFLLQFCTFQLVCLTWIFFRAQTFSESMGIIEQIFTINSFYSHEEWSLFRPQNWLFGLIIPYIFIYVIEKFSFENTSDIVPLWRAILFCVFLFLIFLVAGATNEFIYFQF